ncbi:MAG TPA: ABC transporter permease [Solirubrobacteraceae bacterium]|jgi:peptide/nickel transport system permease protein|nr:ABC transporter permease [Solirubrobacteraceae bacterium]
MLRFIVRRVIGMIAVLFAISVITFAIFNVIPNGDPAFRLAGHSATPATIATIRHEWGFDKPVYVQYEKTMEKIFNGTLISYSTQTNVDTEIRHDIWPTISLAVGAALLWMFFAICLGMYSALKAGKISDRFLTALALVGISMPVFWVGALLSYYLGFKAGIFPNGGYTSLTSNPVQWAWHLILPWTALSILFIGVYSRLVRSSILDTINEDFVRTARSKGLGQRQVLLKHVLRNSLIPVISLWGLDFGAIIGGGAIVTESVFNLGGVGQYAANSIQSLDVPPVMALTIFIAFFVVLFNTIVDIMYAWLDPRIRLS